MSAIKYFFALIFYLALLGCDNSIKAQKTIALAPEGLFSAALSENYALLGTAKGNAELWQLKPQKLIHEWQHTDDKNGIIALAISAGEDYAVTAERDSIAWWRMSDGTLLTVWSLPGISSVSLSPKGDFALIGLPDKAVYFALQYGKTLYAFTHQKAISVSTISDSGKYALTGSNDGEAKLWDLTTGELKHAWQHQTKISAATISNDDKFALTNASLGAAKLWKIDDGQLFKQFGPDLMTLSSAIFSHNGKYLLTGRTSQSINLWQVKTAKTIKSWRPDTGDSSRASAASILALSFTDNDKKFYSISSKGILQRWRK